MAIVVHFGCKIRLSTFFFSTCYKIVADKKVIRFWNFRLVKKNGSPTSISIISKNQLYRIRSSGHSFVALQKINKCWNATCALNEMFSFIFLITGKIIIVMALIESYLHSTLFHWNQSSAFFYPNFIFIRLCFFHTVNAVDLHKFGISKVNNVVPSWENKRIPGEHRLQGISLTYALA